MSETRPWFVLALTILLGWLVYGLIFRRLDIKLPRMPEQLDHLIGVMSLMLIVLFWMVWV